MLPATQEKRHVPVLRAEKVLLRPKGPAIQIARAIGRGIDNNETSKAQGADSSVGQDA